jgi:hypothetical protein
MATAPDAALAQLDARDARALTEPMDVYADDPEAVGASEVAVYNHGDRYIVSGETGFCTCDDWHYRQPEGGCKHYRRVQFERGIREIPAWANRSKIDRGLLLSLEDDS